jgi:hypothetical protein
LESPSSSVPVEPEAKVTFSLKAPLRMSVPAFSTSAVPAPVTAPLTVRGEE